MESLNQEIQRRKSCRAYLDKEVDLEIIEKILDTARWAPSGSNHQPTHVAVLGKDTKHKLSTILAEKNAAGVTPNPDYKYSSKEWAGDHYELRRKECGAALYRSMGIPREDIIARNKHWEDNFYFFHAPVGMIIYLEKNMPVGSWIDAGMFIQNVLLAAQGFGLASCAQAAFASYPDAIREVLNLENADIICGIAIGYEDKSHPLNSYRIGREPVSSFTKWYQ